MATLIYGPAKLNPYNSKDPIDFDDVIAIFFYYPAKYDESMIEFMHFSDGEYAAWDFNSIDAGWEEFVKLAKLFSETQLYGKPVRVIAPFFKDEEMKQYSAWMIPYDDDGE